MNNIFNKPRVEEDFSQKYKYLLTKYKTTWRQIRWLEKNMADPWKLSEKEIERNQLHNELKKIAPHLGKSDQDVNIDILIGEGDLSEYKLPEFRMVSLEKICSEMVRPQVVRAEGDNVLHPKLNAQVELTKEEISDEFLFIPFGQEVSWHLFDNDYFFERDVDDLERRRRALMLKKLESDTLFVEITSFTTFHRGVNMFGVVFKKDQYIKIIDTLRLNREHLSVDARFIPPEIIDHDFEQIIEDDVNQIKSYCDSEDDVESIEYLLQRYQREFTDSYIKKIPPDLQNKYTMFLEALIESTLIEKQREKIEVDVDRAIDESEKSEGLLKLKNRDFVGPERKRR